MHSWSKFFPKRNGKAEPIDKKEKKDIPHAEIEKIFLEIESFINSPTELPNDDKQFLERLLKTWKQRQSLKDLTAALYKRSNISECYDLLSLANLFCRRLARLIDPKRVNSLLMPKVAASDLSNSLNKLLPGQFIISDDTFVFIHLSDFFSASFVRIKNHEKNGYQYLSSSYKPVILSADEQLRIERGTPLTSEFFTLADDIARATAGTFLDHLQKLREGLRKGDVKHNGWEYEAGPEANVAIAKFKTYYDALPTPFKTSVEVFVDGTLNPFTLRKVFDYLFNPKKASDEQGSNYCIDFLGGVIDRIIATNIKALRTPQTWAQVERLEKLKDKIENVTSNPLICCLLARQFHALPVLIEEKRKFLHQPDKEGNALLDWAVSCAPREVIETLINEGAEITSNSVLIAAQTGRADIVEYFLKNSNPALLRIYKTFGIDFTAQTTQLQELQDPNYAKTPFKWNIGPASIKLVKLLLLDLKDLKLSLLDQMGTISAEIKPWLFLRENLGPDYPNSVYKAQHCDYEKTCEVLEKSYKLTNFIVEKLKHFPRNSQKYKELSKILLNQMSACMNTTALDAKLKRVYNIVSKHTDQGIVGLIKFTWMRKTDSEKDLKKILPVEVASLTHKRHRVC